MDKKPKIVTALPGPKAKEIIKKDAKYVSTSYTRGYPLVAERGYGSMIEDPDGNIFLDFSAGIAVAITGHCHPDVVKAISDQAGKLIHMSGTDFYYKPQVNLAERLSKLSPGKGEKKVFFANSGAEANECAIKLAKYHTGKKRFLAFFGAFHGRTHATLALTGSKAVQRERFYPLMDGVTHVPYAYCYRCPYGTTRDKCHMECVKFIEDTLFKTVAPPKEIAGIFVESIQGEGGYVVPPQEFLLEIKKLCEKYDILYIADEIQSGMGRTGKFFAFEHVGIVPDIITLAKGIASGLPLGVCIASEEIMDWTPGSHASTFGGNPVACQAALTTLDIVEKSLMENAGRQGEYMIERLKDLMNKYDQIGQVRGKGLMIGVEFVKDRESKEREPALRDAVVSACFEEGLLVLGCGPNTLRFCPPLIVDREQVECALEIFESGLKKALVKLAYHNFPF